MEILHELKPRSKICKRENLSQWNDRRERKKERFILEDIEMISSSSSACHYSDGFSLYLSIMQSFYHAYRQRDHKRSKGRSPPLFFSFPPLWSSYASQHRTSWRQKRQEKSLLLRLITPLSFYWRERKEKTKTRQQGREEESKRRA